MFLLEVLRDIIHEPRSRCAPRVSIELLARNDEVPSNVHLVRTFDLAQVILVWQLYGGVTWTYCGSHEGKDTDWSVSDSWVFVRNGFHDAR